MTHADNNLPGDTQLQVPERLAADLRGLAQPGFAVPEEIDARIADLSRRHFAALRRRRRALRWVSAAAAAAAAVVLTVWMGAPRSRDPLDVNGDGRVDVLDAFALEASIERNDPRDAALDFTRDGAVDRADVDFVAMNVVSLTRGVRR